MQPTMPRNSLEPRVVRGDGVTGKITAVKTDSNGDALILVQFEDNSHLVVPPRMLLPLAGGDYGLRSSAAYPQRLRSS